MTAEPAPLRLVGDPEVERLRKAVAALRLDLENANVDLIAKRRRITALENELADRRKRDPDYATAYAIFDYWRKRCRPKAKTFSEDRAKAVMARLRDKDADDPKKAAYSPRYICEAIIGAQIGAHVDESGKKFDDLELVCRSGRRLEAFHEKYERWKAAQA